MNRRKFMAIAAGLLGPAPGRAQTAAFCAKIALGCVARESAVAH
jgi:hypothetical protein